MNILVELSFSLPFFFLFCIFFFFNILLEKNKKQKFKPNKRKYYDFECENQSVRDGWVTHLRNLIHVTR